MPRDRAEHQRRRAERRDIEQYGALPMCWPCRRCLAGCHQPCVPANGGAWTGRYHVERVEATHGKTRLHPGNGVRLRRPLTPTTTT